ncbi:hypothetical protein AnigIFM50267_007104 [Aspergillus niger]|nr:hypothetical protein AnigIFM50267_007104 [Aspergillus niger]
MSVSELKNSNTVSISSNSSKRKVNMRDKEDKSYFLYGFGHKPEQLCLGHLSFGTYSKPIKDSLWYCPGVRLEVDEVHKWANVTRIDNQWFRTNPSIHISCDVNALDLVTLGASFLKSREMFVHAKAGRKVELKDPREFLSEKVLEAGRCRETLERWLVLDKFSLKNALSRPKIWYLTGLYELEDTMSLIGDTNTIGLRGVVSAELLALLAAAPVGASAEVARAKLQMQSVQVKEPLVWAARYQLLDAKYLYVEDDEPVPQNLVRLKGSPILSKGGFRGSEKDANCAELSLVEPNPDLAREGDYEECEEYWKPFLAAQKELEKVEKSGQEEY